MHSHGYLTEDKTFLSWQFTACIIAELAVQLFGVYLSVHRNPFGSHGAIGQLSAEICIPPQAFRCQIVPV